MAKKPDTLKEREKCLKKGECLKGGKEGTVIRKDREETNVVSPRERRLLQGHLMVITSPSVELKKKENMSRNIKKTSVSVEEEKPL